MIEVDETMMEWSEGMTISSLLKSLGDTEYCAVVRLNGKLVSSPNFVDSLIPDNSKLQLLPLVAGG